MKESLQNLGCLAHVGAVPPGESHQVPHPAGPEAAGEAVPVHHTERQGRQPVPQPAPRARDAARARQQRSQQSYGPANP